MDKFIEYLAKIDWIDLAVEIGLALFILVSLARIAFKDF